ASIKVVSQKKMEEKVTVPETKNSSTLLPYLKAINDAFEKNKLELTQNDEAVLPKMIMVFDDLKQSEIKSEQSLKLLVDTLAFLDAMYYKYSYGSRYKSLTDAIMVAEDNIILELKESGYNIFPEKNVAKIDDVLQSLGSVEGAVQSKDVLSSSSKGDIIEIRRHGVIKDNMLIRSAQLIISAGETSTIADYVYTLRNLVSDLRSDSQSAKDSKIKALDSLKEWGEKLLGSTEEYQLTVARYALNLVYSLKDSPQDRFFPGQMGQFNAILSKLSDYLKKSGLSEILVSLGGVFDESYDPGKYERKRVPAKQPPGTIVVLVRPGFLDKLGVPVQKAVVAVSSG
ncbi:MAG: hypothetical protein ABIH42_11350, partial [Planctomycetota bacterium]